ncbi:dienelactone hydrolase family protein [Kosakonia sacchari]|uniref:Dienelactone hydrolase n=1 Tax=Kosakonia sacchari TaxID=1158459 RepID=A0A1G4YFD6_9ENTR|nr:CocE/NonD family hydrolase [Kosakonia sacchari]AIA25017.1 dienelactone hydrolase [Kosakonia sacchari SP1]SCX52206.1 Dienelactone hydrolase [Kosakonia sacchari]
MRNRFTTRLAKRLFATALLLFTASGHADVVGQAPEYQQIDGLIREPLLLAVTLDNGQPAVLDAFVTRMASQTPLPVVLITNGTVGTAEFDRWIINPNRYAATAIAFARHGYAAVVVLRQGYGQSSGAAEYADGSCAQPLHLRAGEQDTRNLLAALDAVRRQPWAAADNAILAGMSAGGFAVIATGAANPPGVKAVINFDGGRGAIDGKSLCDKAGLLQAYARYGKTAQIPSLWLYAKNDKSFPPSMGKEMFDAYQQGGHTAHFITMPAFGNNGHVFMDSAPENFWWQTVAAFLKQQHLPTGEAVALPETHLVAPPALNAAGKKAFSAYAATQRYEKAFATDEDGDWGAAYWARNSHQAAETALSICQQEQRPGAAKCTVYAINNRVVTGKTP